MRVPPKLGRSAAGDRSIDALAPAGDPHDDLDLPSALEVFGGLCNVPAGLRSFVERALIFSSGKMSDEGMMLFDRSFGGGADAVTRRTQLASKARHAARVTRETSIAHIAEGKVTASAWAELPAERQAQVWHIIFGELQRKCFQGYLGAAKQAAVRAQADLGKDPESMKAQQRLRAAELAIEAATVSPVAGRLPRNHEHAGKQFPTAQLSPEHQAQGLRFTETGFPDFEPHALTLPNGKKYVEIQYTSSRRGDFAAANAQAGYSRTPIGYSWHHSEEFGRMYLVPLRLHDEVKHTGGVATYVHVTGVKPYGG